MNYDQAVEYIHGTKRYGSKLGLTNITKLLELLGNPQEKLKFVHVAGTNGKGSVCSYITSTLIEGKYKTGLFISPYIEKFTERIQINFNNMEEKYLVDIVTRVKYCVGLMLLNKMNHPTEFEINTAIAMVYFYEQKCDIVVLETGLGGRYDSTNVIKSNIVAVITALGLDHMTVLGDTIEKIAFEKAGIIKKNNPTVLYGDNDIKAIEMIKYVAKENNSDVIMSDYKKVSNIKQTPLGYTFDYKNLKNIKINLPGKHQIKNCITAIEALYIIKKSGYNITNENILKGIANTYWPGRLEIISKNPLVICDGAHNVHAAHALHNYLNEFYSNKQIIFVMGVMRNKEYKKMIEIVIKDAKSVICIQPNNERALDKEMLASEVRKYCNNVYVSDTINLGMDMAYKLCDNDLICTFGSLYYIADVKKYVGERLINEV